MLGNQGILKFGEFGARMKHYAWESGNFKVWRVWSLDETLCLGISELINPSSE